MAVMAFVQAALFLFSAAVIALPKLSPHHMGVDLFTGFSVIVNTWVSLAFVALKFHPQYVELRRQVGTPGALSLLALGLQRLVLVMMATWWLQRLGAPTWEDQVPPPTSWYQWGWLPMNYLLNGIGCAILLGMSLRTGRGGVRLTGEQRRLFVA